MRRLAFLLLVVLLVSACGGRKARVSIPKGGELEGIASYYAEPYHGRRTASGEIFDTYKELTAAHRTLPFNSIVRVTNKTNGESVDVRINDRGPFVNGRVIDLSLLAAQRIDMVRAGVAPVKLRVLKTGDGARVVAPPAPPGTSALTGSTVPAAVPAASMPAAAPPPQPGAAPVLYAVQVGAFQNRQSAEDLKSRLELRYSGVSIQPLEGEVTLYRVRIGPESDLAAAEKLAAQLRQEDFSPFVVRLN